MTPADQSVIDAGRTLMDADPVLGSMIVLLMAVVGYLTYWIRNILKEKDERLDAHLEDVRKYAAETEATRSIISANTAQITANTETTKIMIEVFKERVQR